MKKKNKEKIEVLDCGTEKLSDECCRRSQPEN